MILINILIILVLAGVLFWEASLLFASVLGAPTVYADDGAVADAFELAGLKQGELVIDLGCGNAKALIMAARRFGARGIGVERSPYAYLLSKLNVRRAHQTKKIKIYFGDFKKVQSELNKADVVYVYLLNQVLVSIEAWLFEAVGAKTRIVSLAFEFKYHQSKKSKGTMSLGRQTMVRLYSK
mgnify:FL=1